MNVAGQRTVHEDIDKQDLHRIQRIAQPKHRAERDQRQRSRSRAQLERQEVLNVVENRFA